ncbi:succinic semialdehyde dehydrogenase [Halobacteriales archaeon Cl-PHB]
MVPAGVDVPSPPLDRLAAGVTTVPDADREGLPVAAPFSGETVGSVPAGTSADVEAAFERAREAQRDWADRSLADRAAVLSTLADEVLANQGDLLDLVQLEAGKARYDAFEEVLDVVASADHYADRAEHYLGTERRGGALPLVTKTTVAHHAHGVVGIISPWNYPLTLAVSDALPALLAGNAVVLKPAEEAPFTALQARELLVDAGLPADCFQVVTGEGSTVGPPLVEAADYVGFTGGTETGRTVAAQAAESLTPHSLELGGKNPMVVLDDADLEKSVTGALRGCFASAGQLCISFERIYVEEPVFAEFRDRFVRRTRGLTLGTGFDYDADVGSLISERHLETVSDHLDDAVEAGADLLTGGRHRPDVGPNFFEPSVLTAVPEGADLSDEETFGPVVRVEPVADEAEAIERANDTDYGLNASVWTSDTERGARVAGQIRSGTVGVNDPYVATWGSIGAPMGGMGKSGMGRRHGREGIEKYTESQTVAVQRGHPLAPPAGVSKGLVAGLATGYLRLRRWLPGWPP